MVNSFLKLIAAQLPRVALRGQCILCAAKGQAGLDICPDCEAELPFLGPCCHRCALPLGQLAEPYCGQCLTSPPPFLRTEAVWEYQPPIMQLIAGFKYQQRLSYGNALAIMASKKFVSAYIDNGFPDVIAPAPLHWRRRLVRGFNQSDVLARVIARRLNIPLSHTLKRCQHTPPQQGLNARQRKLNLRGAFAVDGNIKGQTIAVVDDVMTTGATADAISRCLLAGGAAEVHIWCLARTPN